MNARPARPAPTATPKMTLDRLSALSDGVVAIVITLLVLGIDLPEDHNFSTEGLISFLGKVEYQLVVYAVSFVLAGNYWVQQNVMFHYFRNGTRGLTWLNLLFLFELTILPFTTKLIGTYRDEPLPLVIYGAVHIACGMTLALIWWYANRMSPVVSPRTDPAVARSFLLRILSGPLVSLIAIGAAFVNARLSHVVFLTMPLFHLSHRIVDSHWDSDAEQQDDESR